tara:strand:+ start:450 stop:719 length:270 start_codon:yes stop_codon:yes gene_type:complete
MLSFLNNTKGILSLIFLALFSADIAIRGSAETGISPIIQFIFNYGLFFLILFLFTLFFKSESAKTNAFFISAIILFAFSVIAFLGLYII